MRNDLNKVLMNHHDSRRDDRIRKPRQRFSKDEIERAIEDDDYETSPKPFRADAWNRERQTYPRVHVLQQWLKAKVGRLWDEVYSELSQVPPMGGYTITEVLKYTVEQHPMFINGVPYDSAGRFPLDGWGRYHQFYVDEQGILQMTNTPRIRYGRKCNPNVVELGPMHELVRMNGLWFDVAYKPNPRPEGYPRWATWADRIIADKKTLNAKELKKFGLSNTTASGKIEE